MKKEFVITPWKVKGKVDYDRLMKEFGIQPFDPLLKEIPDPNLYMRRGIIFGHRDFERIIDCIKNKKEYIMMTGLMPSGKFHLGHKMLADQIIYYQRHGAKIFLCVADIEAFNMRLDSLEKLRKIAVEEYLLNYIALGLKPKNCDFYFQSDRSDNGEKSNAYYRLMQLAARKTTINEMKSIYGDLTPGKIVSVLTQISDILHTQLKEFGGRRPVLVPVGPDQDPHIKLTRDIATRFNKSEEFDFILPSSTYHKFMVGLKGDKMASSDPTSFIALTDDPKTVEEKIMKHAFSGGRISVKEHREKGGIPEIDVSYQMLYFMFEEDDKKLKKIYDDYKSGDMLTGELKQILIDKLNKFLKDHQKRREKARNLIGRFVRIEN